MSLFEEFFRQINPQQYNEDEEIKSVESDNEYLSCPVGISASQLVEYIIYLQNYLLEKKQN
jgi:hypothetical protein